MTRPIPCPRFHVLPATPEIGQFGYKFATLEELSPADRTAGATVRLWVALALAELGTHAEIRLLVPSPAGADLVSSCSIRGITDPGGWLAVVVAGTDAEMFHAAHHEARHRHQHVRHPNMDTLDAELDAERWARARCAPTCSVCAEPVESLAARATAGSATLTHPTPEGDSHD